MLALVEAVQGGSIVRHLIERMPMVQAHQARKALAQLLDAIEANEAGFLSRVEHDPRLLRLVWDLAQFAARSDSDAKLRALARIAQAGARDDAKLDEARFLRLRKCGVGLAVRCGRGWTHAA